MKQIIKEHLELQEIDLYMMKQKSISYDLNIDNLMENLEIAHKIEIIEQKIDLLNEILEEVE